MGCCLTLLKKAAAAPAATSCACRDIQERLSMPSSMHHHLFTPMGCRITCCAQAVSAMWCSNPGTSPRSWLFSCFVCAPSLCADSSWSSVCSMRKASCISACTYRHTYTARALGNRTDGVRREPQGRARHATQQGYLLHRRHLLVFVEIPRELDLAVPALRECKAESRVEHWVSTQGWSATACVCYAVRTAACVFAIYSL